MITSLESWLEIAPPKGRERHWRDRRSAKELARAWVGGGVVCVPPEISALLASHPELADLTLVSGEPEARVRFDKRRGEPRNADLSIDARAGTEPVALSIEAKADEPFGSSLPDALACAVEARVANPRSAALDRVIDVCCSLLRARSREEPALRHLDYQLLTATAGVIAQAEKLSAKRAILVVHEFRSIETRPESLAANTRSLNVFVSRLSGGAVTTVEPGRLIGPLDVGGPPLFERPARLYLGKAVREC